MDFEDFIRIRNVLEHIPKSQNRHAIDTIPFELLFLHPFQRDRVDIYSLSMPSSISHRQKEFTTTDSNVQDPAVVLKPCFTSPCGKGGMMSLDQLLPQGVNDVTLGSVRQFPVIVKIILIVRNLTTLEWQETDS